MTGSDHPITQKRYIHKRDLFKLKIKLLEVSLVNNMDLLGLFHNTTSQDRSTPLVELKNIVQHVSFIVKYRNNHRPSQIRPPTLNIPLLSNRHPP